MPTLWGQHAQNRTISFSLTPKTENDKLLALRQVRTSGILSCPSVQYAALKKDEKRRARFSWKHFECARSLGVISAEVRGGAERI